ncbi:MAG: hypothetical protein WBW61_12505, partial [Rhodanobacteraceae bacterium]
MKAPAFLFVSMAFVLSAAAGVAGCQAVRHSAATASTRPDAAEMPVAGTFDNHAQVWQSHENASPVPPHVVLTIDAANDQWSIWHVHLDAAVAAMDASWAMRRSGGTGGPTVRTPYRALSANPAGGKDFDARQWAVLDACALTAAPSRQAFRATANAAA